MVNGFGKTLLRHRNGQSMVEFAMILPLLVLFIIGIFDLGRAFFAYIAITNAAREGTRVATFWPGKVSISDVQNAVYDEIGTSPMVDPGKIQLITIDCVHPPATTPYTLGLVHNNTELMNCSKMNPIRVTVEYKFDSIFKFFFPAGLLLHRSAEMMIP